MYHSQHPSYETYLSNVMLEGKKKEGNLPFLKQNFSQPYLALEFPLALILIHR